INSDPPSIVSWSINGIYAPLAFDSNAFKVYQGYDVYLNLSKKAGNTLTLEEDGLFSSINTDGKLFFDNKSFAGTGTKDDPYRVNVLASSNSLLHMTSNGLEVPINFVSPLDSSGFPDNNVRLTISQKAGNSLTLESDGLYVVPALKGRTSFMSYLDATSSTTEIWKTVNQIIQLLHEANIVNINDK
ncbi:hypothetical protein PSI23_11190, partial [Xenorhabdus sp. XENO-10]